MKTDNFFTELKRRNVYKVAVAYIVGGWALVQTASILFPTFEAPQTIVEQLHGQLTGRHLYCPPKDRSFPRPDS